MWNISVHKEGSLLTVPNQSLLLWNFNEKLGGVFIKEHQSIAVLNQSFLFILLVLTMIFFFSFLPRWILPAFHCWPGTSWQCIIT